MGKIAPPKTRLGKGRLVFLKGLSNNIGVLPRIFHDNFAARVTSWCIVALIAIWGITFAWGENEMRDSLTAQVVEIVKLVATTSLGILVCITKIKGCIIV